MRVCLKIYKPLINKTAHLVSPGNWSVRINWRYDRSIISRSRSCDWFRRCSLYLLNLHEIVHRSSNWCPRHWLWWDRVCVTVLCVFFRFVITLVVYFCNNFGFGLDDFIVVFSIINGYEFRFRNACRNFRNESANNGRFLFDFFLFFFLVFKDKSRKWSSMYLIFNFNFMIN